MKLFAKLMIATLFIAMLLPFAILKGKDGTALMSIKDIGLPDFSLPDLPDLPKLPKANDFSTSDESLAGKDIFYKWNDAEGNVQFTTEPPAAGIEYTIKGFDPDANVIQAVKIPPKESTSKEAKSNAPKSDKAGEIGSPYSKESIEKLFKDAKNIENMLNQRFNDQQSQVNQ